jgi:hypothetical protein
MTNPEIARQTGPRRVLVEKLQALLDTYAAKSPLPDFFRWACSDRNPERESWFELTGINENITLISALLEGMGDPAQVEQMWVHALPMGAYQVLEELSDRLSGPCSGALAAASNRATVQCLAGEKYRAAELLRDAKSLADGLSLYSASRDADRFRAITAQYVRDTRRSSVEAIDGSLWALLVTKAESCRMAAFSVRDRWLGPMVTQGLMDRFRRGGSAMADGSVPVSRRLMASADSSRSLPVLAFYVAVLEPVLQFETLEALPVDATFSEALNVAAMLARLLKDVGTPLLVNDWMRPQFARLLDQQTVGRGGADLAAVLREEAGKWGEWAARLTPDAERVDANICLSGLLHLPLAVAIPRLCDRIEYLAGVFANGRRYLERLSQDITVQVWSEGPATLILRFVDFHERLYSAVSTASRQRADLKRSRNASR